MTRRITIGVVVVALVVLVGWDVFVAVESTPDDTVSEITQGFALRYPVIGHALGIVLGHLVIPTTQPRRYWLLGASVVAWAVAGVVVQGQAWALPAAALSGVVVGVLGWGQRPGASGDQR